MPQIVYIGDGKPLSETTQQIGSLEEALKHLQQAPENEIYVVNPYLREGTNLPKETEIALSKARNNFGVFASSVVLLKYLEQRTSPEMVIIVDLNDGADRQFFKYVTKRGYNLYNPYDHGSSIDEIAQKISHLV